MNYTTQKIIAVEKFCENHDVKILKHENPRLDKIYINGKRVQKKYIGAEIFLWYEIRHGFEKKRAGTYRDLEKQLIFHVKYNTKQII